MSISSPAAKCPAPHPSSGPLKIAHVITRLIIGGAQENTVFTAQGLRETYGHDVTLITGPPLGPEGSLLNEAWRNTVRCILLPQMRRAPHPLRDAIAFLQLYNIFRRQRYDIVHTHSSKAGILGRFAASLAGIRTIVHTIHGLPFHPYQGKVANHTYVLLERLSAKVSTKIVCVADAMTKQALERKIAPEEKFITIHSGMDLDSFLAADSFREQTRRAFGLSQDDVVIGMIARLFPLKGHKYLFAAAPEIVRRFPHAKFLLVGEGILRNMFHDALQRLGLSDKFLFAGLVHPGRIPEMISAMDILVHTSLREGLAKALPQAMACGKPVVSFDVDGAREVVENGVTGYLVPPKDVRGLTAALCKLLADPDAGTRMGLAGRDAVDPAFRKEVMVEKINKLYNDLRRRRPHSGGKA